MECTWASFHELRRECTHPYVHLGQQPLTPQVCRHCQYRTTANGRREATSKPMGAVKTWAVGVTTAPRRRPTLQRTLRSLKAAGWEAPRLFVDAPARVCGLAGNVTQTVRDHPLGAFPNWYLGLTELVLREPRVDAYLMLQDDVVLARQTRSFLEQVLWPCGNTGVVSLYCESRHARGGPAGFRAVQRLAAGDTEAPWGALALVLPASAAQAAITSQRLLGHRLYGRDEGLRHIEFVVQDWCRRQGRVFYIPQPSLAQHIGDTSTIWGGAPNSGRRRASHFVGEDADLTTVLNDWRVP